MSNPNCPKCSSEHTYQDGSLWICPMCSHEWNPDLASASQNDNNAENDEGFVVRDANGNILQEGDSVTVIKDLKVKGSSTGVKIGTKVRNIHLVESTDGHNISCKVDGIGAMHLKSEFVRKS